MTRRMFYEDAYLKQLKTKIVAIEPSEGQWQLITAETIFYPQGGGQPGDRGWLLLEDGKRIEISNTRYSTNRQHIIHYLDDVSTAGLAAGTCVTLELDWERRHRLMRMHTSMHLMCSIIPAPVTGGGVNERQSRCEFDVQTSDWDKEQLTRQLNELVEAALPVSISYITEQQLDDNPELVRTMSVQPPRGFGDIRMIRVGEGIDYQPCGGTHVANTEEIGRVRITGIKSKGKQNKRFNIELED
ncbi:alanyl-tRNA editing protein [Gynuella sp.]|uniref:alanyl-tRNA editing protein n=1 Tax=Gynuella sp. TaxID=2969146 RepID=UPI003D0AAD52